MRSSDTAQVFFDNVRIPQSHLIGEEGKGFIYQMEQFQEERLFCAGNVLKSLDICIQDTIEYTRSRKAFNATLLDNQYIQYRLGELQTEFQKEYGTFDINIEDGTINYPKENGETDKED